VNCIQNLEQTAPDQTPRQLTGNTVNTTASNTSKHIRIGIGGWTFEPWRDNFYPSGLTHSKELHHASRQLSAIEVNGTYYSTFKPPTFAKWHSETPEGFMFSLKANRFATNRRVLANAGDSITRFVESGISELKDKLGPIVWQFMPTKPFEPGDFEAFLALLPSAVDGRKLRHALDVRHESFATPAFLALARRYGCVPVHTDSPKFPAIADARRLCLPAPDAQPGRCAHRLHPRGHRPVGRWRARLDQRRASARRVRVFHQRRQGAGTCWRGGLAGAARPEGLVAGGWRIKNWEVGHMQDDTGFFPLCRQRDHH
jgi:uncharacterized protein YecE (DUF72 family)